MEARVTSVSAPLRGFHVTCKHERSRREREREREGEREGERERGRERGGERERERERERDINWAYFVSWCMLYTQEGNKMHS